MPAATEFPSRGYAPMPDGYSSHRALHRAPYPAERYRAASENRHYFEAEILDLQRFRDKPARIPQPLNVPRATPNARDERHPRSVAPYSRPGWHERRT